MDQIDKKTRDALIGALEKAKNGIQKIQERRERSLWKNVNVPCTLYDALNNLTKYQMDTIRKNYGFKNLSSLKKGELALELAKLIPMKFEEIMYMWDKGIYDLIKSMDKNSGIIPYKDFPLWQIEVLMKYSIAFPGIYNNQNVLYMPKELLNIFYNADRIKLKDMIRRNTEWIRLTHGLLYYYGVADVGFAVNKVKELSKVEVDSLEYFMTIRFAIEFYEQIEDLEYYYVDSRVFDAEQVLDEQRLRPDLTYYPFSKQELLKAGEPDYIEITSVMKDFIRFLLDHYDMTVEDAEEITIELTEMINDHDMPADLLEFLQSCLEFPSFEFTQEMMEEVTELYHNTRLWELKGYTPNELHQKEMKNLNPLPTAPLREEQTNIVDIKTRKKIGRNDPCPCGSGKKYKRCCGR